jgi:hypothetical protein
MAAAVDPMTTTTFLKQIQIDRIMAEIELINQRRPHVRRGDIGVAPVALALALAKRQSSTDVEISSPATLTSTSKQPPRAPSALSLATEAPAPTTPVAEVDAESINLDSPYPWPPGRGVAATYDPETHSAAPPATLTTGAVAFCSNRLLPARATVYSERRCRLLLPRFDRERNDWRLVDWIGNEDHDSSSARFGSNPTGLVRFSR